MTRTEWYGVDIFTKISQHRNHSVVYLTTNIFYKHKQTRTLSLNSHYIVLFKNERDVTQVVNLARQMFPGKSAFMIDAITNATSAWYGYLLIDLKQKTDDKHRLRTGIVPEDVQHVYLRKK